MAKSKDKTETADPLAGMTLADTDKVLTAQPDGEWAQALDPYTGKPYQVDGSPVGTA